jgi:glycosyl transferase family 25
MQAYLINLDGDHERLAHFKRQAKLAGIEFERLSAVDGRKLAPEDYQKLISPKFEFAPMTPAEFGLLGSHRKAWECFLQTNQQNAAVFEDDAILAPDLGAALTEIDRAKVPFDIVKLETTRRTVVLSQSGETLSSGYQLHQLLTWHGGTAGYVISRAGAEKLLSWKAEPHDTSTAATDAPLLCSASVLDQMLFNPFSKVCSRLRVMQMNPAGCIQNDILARQTGGANFGSTIQPGSRKTKFLRYGVWIGLTRLIRKIREKAYRRKLSRQPENMVLSVEFLNRADSASVRTVTVRSGKPDGISEAA